jgi:CheY-like chemotaxis protein
MRVKPLILAIDDDPFFQKTIEVVLTRLGFQTKTVGTIPEFRENASSLTPDMFLIDLQIGTESGLVLIEEIRRTWKLKTPIIVISGTGDPEIICHAIEFGANDYIHKPVDRLALAAKLGQFFRTDELDEQGKFLDKLDAKGVAARLKFKGEISALDELGVKFVSPHLIPKGTVIKLKAPFIEKIRQKKDECLVCVTATTLNSDTGIYEIYAEFEEADMECLQAVRGWLVQAKNTLQ